MYAIIPMIELSTITQSIKILIAIKCRDYDYNMNVEELFFGIELNAYS